MTNISLQWHGWNRLELRTIFPSQLEAIEKGELKYPIIDEPSATRQSFIHRLVMLLWIGEYEFARKLFEDSEYYHGGASLAEYLFDLVIMVREIGWGGWHFSHPEYYGVRYGFLYGREAFNVSTVPLSCLLKMDYPYFSSIDGLVDIKFDKGELERIAIMVPQKYHQELRLPLLLLRSQQGKYKLIGGKTEEFLLHTLLKLTKAPFEKFKETPYAQFVNDISTLRRRKFNTIYKVFFELEQAEFRSETSNVWLNARYDPYWPKSIQAPVSDKI